MDAENFVVDDRSECQIVKNLRAVAPHVHRPIFSEALIIKAIDAADLSGFMVAPEQGNVAWIPNLQTHQQLKSLH